MPVYRAKRNGSSLSLRQFEFGHLVERYLVHRELPVLVLITGARRRRDGYALDSPAAGPSIQLYDLDNDPAEMVDLAGQDEHAGRVEIRSGRDGRTLATLASPDGDRLFGFAVAAVTGFEGGDAWLVGGPLGVQSAHKPGHDPTEKPTGRIAGHHPSRNPARLPDLDQVDAECATIVVQLSLEFW